MVQYKYKNIRSFIKFVKRELDINRNIKVKLIKGASVIKIQYMKNGKFKTIYSLGAYDLSKNKIYIPLNSSPIDVYISIGQQFYNAKKLEKNESMKINESEIKAIELYLNWKRNN